MAGATNKNREIQGYKSVSLDKIPFLYRFFLTKLTEKVIPVKSGGFLLSDVFSVASWFFRLRKKEARYVLNEMKEWGLIKIVGFRIVRLTEKGKLIIRDGEGVKQKKEGGSNGRSEYKKKNKYKESPEPLGRV